MQEDFCKPFTELLHHFVDSRKFNFSLAAAGFVDEAYDAVIVFSVSLLSHKTNCRFHVKRMSCNKVFNYRSNTLIRG